MVKDNIVNSIEKRKVRVDHLHYIFALFATFTFVFTVAFARNPDTDAYFLIDNGKYIIENKSVPTENIWTIHQGFDIIIQQPICSILNYLAYSFGGWLGLRLLAIVELLVFTLSLYNYICEYTNSNKIKIIIVCLLDLTFCLFFTTRPYPITMSCITYEITILHRLYTSKENGKSVSIKLCALSLFLINYQSASWYFIFVMMLPYIVPWIFITKKESNKIILEKVSEEEYKALRDREDITRTTLIRTIPFMLCLGLINPNGVEGIKYLWYSYSVVKGDAIQEMRSPSYMSLAGGVVVLFLILYFIYLLRNKNSEKPVIYLATGTMLLAMMSGRNNWMLVGGFVPFLVFILSKFITDDKPKLSSRYVKGIVICEYIIGYILVFAISIGVLSACQQNINTYNRNDIVDYLNTKDKDKLILYTDFNTGAYFEFRGFKVYIDARPELYMKKINGKEDIYTEYMNMLHQKLDVEEFLNKYKFTHLIAQRPSVIDTYLYYSDDYKLINEDDSCRLYERLEWENE